MAKETTLNDIAAMLKKQSDEIKDLTGSVAFVVEHMATKEQVAALHTQVNSIEAQLPQTKADRRLADLEEKVFGASRAWVRSQNSTTSASTIAPSPPPTLHNRNSLRARRPHRNSKIRYALTIQSACTDPPISVHSNLPKSVPSRNLSHFKRQTGHLV